MAEQTHLRESWSAVQENQNWIRDGLTADHHPLIEPAKTKVIDLRNAAWHGVAVRSMKRWSGANTFQVIACGTQLVPINGLLGCRELRPVLFDDIDCENSRIRRERIWTNEPLTRRLPGQERTSEWLDVCFTGSGN